VSDEPTESEPSEPEPTEPEEFVTEEDFANDDAEFLADDYYAEAGFVEPGGIAPDFVEPTGLFDAPGEDTETVTAPTEPGGTRRALTDRERAMLVFERKWWRHPGSKEQAIREAFDWSPTQYYQRLNALLDLPAAAEFDPLVVGRLHRLRATRRRTPGSR
jgi:uncharacterized protein DUF3263